MNEKPDESKQEAAKPELSIARILMGQVISLIVTFIVIYPAVLVLTGMTVEDIYLKQNIVIYALGAFVLQFAYMAGFRTRRNRYSTMSDYFTTAMVTVNLGIAAYVFGVIHNDMSELIYWVVMGIAVASTMVPVAVYDLLKVMKPKSDDVVAPSATVGD